MFAETNVDSIATYAQIANGVGFAGLVWYLISVVLPRHQLQAETTRTSDLKVMTDTVKELAASIQVLEERFSKTLTEQQQRFELSQSAHRQESKEQISLIVQKHEETVRTLVGSQEKQIDRLLDNFSKCKNFQS